METQGLQRPRAMALKNNRRASQCGDVRRAFIAFVFYPTLWENMVVPKLASTCVYRSATTLCGNQPLPQEAGGQTFFFSVSGASGIWDMGYFTHVPRTRKKGGLGWVMGQRAKWVKSISKKFKLKR